jgi:serine/threonine protein kinase
VLRLSPNHRSNTPGAIVLQPGAEPSPGYKLRRVRGRGGFAEVWEAWAPSGPPVALKFIPVSNGSTTIREVRSMQAFLSLSHPYLVKTNAVWCLPGYIVINMELADATLLDLMLVYHNELGQHVDPTMLCLYLWQVSEALDFLNARHHNFDGRRVGFQHGDVKPNNLLLIGDTAKLTDHGLATPTHGPNTPCPRQGTREYAAPEVFQGYYSDASDQFSLAVTYHVLRTGTFPFPPPPEQISRSFSRPPADLAMVTEPEQAPLLRALSAVPQDRWPSCRDFMAEMLAALKLKVTREGDGPYKVVKDATAASKPGSGPLRIPSPSQPGVFRRSNHG